MFETTNQNAMIYLNLPSKLAETTNQYWLDNNNSYSWFTHIYPLKNVIFHRFLSLKVMVSIAFISHRDTESTESLCALQEGDGALEVPGADLAWQRWIVEARCGTQWFAGYKPGKRNQGVYNLQLDFMEPEIDSTYCQTFWDSTFTNGWWQCHVHAFGIPNGQVPAQILGVVKSQTWFHNMSSGNGTQVKTDVSMEPSTWASLLMSTLDW